jgi:hypothetical protein
MLCSILVQHSIVCTTGQKAVAGTFLPHYNWVGADCALAIHPGPGTFV